MVSLRVQTRDARAVVRYDRGLGGRRTYSPAGALSLYLFISLASILRAAYFAMACVMAAVLSLAGNATETAVLERAVNAEGSDS